MNQCWLHSLTHICSTRGKWVNVCETLQSEVSLEVLNCYNSVALGIYGWNLKLVKSNLISRVNILRISCKIALRWISKDSTDDSLTLVWVMALYHQETSYYLCKVDPDFDKLICSSEYWFKKLRIIKTHHKLTHRGRDKMDAILRRHFQVHFLEWKCLNSD